MKIKYLVATIVLTGVFVGGVLNVYHQSQKDQMSDTALANIEALAGDDPSGGEGSGEGGGSSGHSICATQIQESGTSMVLVCGDCKFVSGVGTQFKGYCKW